MRLFLPIAWRRRPRVDIYARPGDGTRELERGMISDASYHTFSDVGCIEANIMIDKDGNARLAGFGHVTIISDLTHSETATLSEDSEDSEISGTLRWMSPELLFPEQFGAWKNRPTEESDCYALGMVVLEVLTGKTPFPRCNNFIVMKKIIDKARPDRPTGPEATWFTDDLWAVLEQCWSHEPKQRPTIQGVLECLERGSATWKPLSPSTDSDFQVDSDDDLASPTSHHSGVFFHLVFDLNSPEQPSS